MTMIFLTPDEVKDLTGFQRPSKQIEWLRENGFAYRVAADGHARVLREHVSQMMGLSTGGKARKLTEPDFTKLVVA